MRMSAVIRPALLTLLLGTHGGTHAALVGLYEFDDMAGAFTAGPSQGLAPLTLGAWSDAAGSLTDFAGNPGRAIAARDWDTGNQLRFQITVPPGNALSLDGFSFDNQSSSSGATDWTLSIDEQTVAGGVTSLSFDEVGGGLSLSGLSGTFWVRLGGSGASSRTGTWRIDNFRLTGELASPVPLPPAAALLAPALLGLLQIRRRRTAARP